MTAFFVACPLCGAAGGLGLFFLILGVFLAMFTGTILLFVAGWMRGEWKDDETRWEAVLAEEPEARTSGGSAPARRWEGTP